MQHPFALPETPLSEYGQSDGGFGQDVPLEEYQGK
jgi:hypothetical protein